MPYLRSILCLCFGLTLAVAGDPVPPPLSQFLSTYCIDCHDNDAPKGRLDLSRLTLGDDLSLQAHWNRVRDRVAQGEMPPANKPRPPQTEIAQFLKELDKDRLDRHQRTKALALRRLTRQEYENTLRDLFGVQVELSDLLPEDDPSGGFDNVALSQGMSEIHIRQYLEAANRVLDAVPVSPKQSPATTARLALHETRIASTHLEKHWLRQGEGTIVFSGTFPVPEFDQFKAPEAGFYRIRLTLAAHAARNPVGFSLLTGQRFQWRQVTSSEAGKDASKLDQTAYLNAGDIVRIVPLLPSPAGLAKTGPAGYTGAGLNIYPGEINGPLPDPARQAGRTLLYGQLDETRPLPRGGPGPTRFEIVSKNPTEDGPILLTQLANALFRRPVNAQDLTPYIQIFQKEMSNGQKFSSALRTAQVALLIAPDFIFHAPLNKSPQALACRLSFLLIRSSPDPALLTAAASGELATPTGLLSQAKRLMADPRHQRFHKDFCDGWLNLRDINATTPDAQLYPEYDAFLQESMLAESQAWLAEMITANRPVVGIVKGDFMMLNGRLARHYGISGVEGPAIRRVAIPANSQRSGVMTHASVLKVTANGTTTSPVRRGVWVLDKLLGQHPPPPPPGIAGLEPDTRGSNSIRTLLAAHRNQDSCAACHRNIDPPGFALERFDPIGGQRSHYRILGSGPVPAPPPGYLGANERIRFRQGSLVDASGEMVGAGSFADFTDFQNLLAGQQDQLAANLLKNFLTFACGREMGVSDKAEMDNILARLKPQGYPVGDLLFAAITSPIFRAP